MSTAEATTCAKFRCPSSNEHKKIFSYHTNSEKSPLAACGTAFEVQGSSDYLSGIDVLIPAVHQFSYYNLQAISFWSPVIQ